MTEHISTTYGVLHSENGPGWDVAKVTVVIDKPTDEFGEIKSLTYDKLHTFRYKSLAESYKQRCKDGLKPSALNN